MPKKRWTEKAVREQKTKFEKAIKNLNKEATELRYSSSAIYNTLKQVAEGEEDEYLKNLAYDEFVKVNESIDYLGDINLPSIARKVGDSYQKLLNMLSNRT